MTSQEIFDLAIKKGIEFDLRGNKKVESNLKRIKDKYDKMSEEEKEGFDKDRLTNPYSDTRLFVANKKNIKKVLVGIDVEGEEMLMAKELGVDAIITHHPQGSGLARLDEVMDLQSEVLALYGVPINIAQSVMRPRISELGRRLGSGNHYRYIEMAEILGLDMMCLHTVCDNLGASFLKDKLEKEKLEYVEDVMKVIKTIPEYQIYDKRLMPSKIFVGSPDAYCGKVVVTEFTGGTSGSKDIYERLSHYSIGTVVGMHMSEEYKAEAEKHHINVVIATHMASDSLGVNLFCDELEKKGIEIIPCSGFVRVSRNKKK